eukprot:scaffold15315_cov36-Cyclotella_meneghiniana.AAC.4
MPSRRPSPLNQSQKCKVSIAGAGPGGIYTAMRLVESKTFNADDICIFELSGSPGGRVKSLDHVVPNKDFVVDAGAYRYVPSNDNGVGENNWYPGANYDPSTMPPPLWYITRITSYLIQEKFKLPTLCYSVEEFCLARKIVDASGRNAGFFTLVKAMLNEITSAGVHVYYSHKLTSISQTEADGYKELTFETKSDVEKVETMHLFLNTGLSPMLNIVRSSSFPMSFMSDAFYSNVVALKSQFGRKLYLFYDDAWWITLLNKADGTFSQAGGFDTVPLEGRYHDGDVACDSTTGACSGFLLALYNSDDNDEGSSFLRRFQGDISNPVTTLTNSTPEGGLLLQKAHEALMAHPDHQTAAALVGLAEPTIAVMSTWNMASEGFGGHSHTWTDRSKETLVRTGLHELGIYLVNEAYSLDQHGWAEGSFGVADKVLENKFGIGSYPIQENPFPANQDAFIGPILEAFGVPVAVGDCATGALYGFCDDEILDSIMKSYCPFACNVV